MGVKRTVLSAVLAGAVCFLWAVFLAREHHAGARTISDPLEIAITGSKFEWHVRYPGPDGVLGTRDDAFSTRDLHVPVGARTRIHLFSKDYIYNIRLPHFGLKEVAVPDLEFFLEFQPGESGTFELRGDQMCGFEHPELLGKLVVESEEAYWNALGRMQTH